MATHRNNQHSGGQHRAAERHRRTYAELGERPTFPVEGFDIDSAPDAEPRPTATESDLVALDRSQPV